MVRVLFQPKESAHLLLVPAHGGLLPLQVLLLVLVGWWLWWRWLRPQADV
jgi:hypothetical protein